MAKTLTEIRSAARSHTEAALNCLVGIMGQTDAPPAARVSAANSLLDRGWGKAEAKHEMTLRRVTAKELPDDELAAIAVGGGDGADAPPIDPAQLN
jgi:hypothetical protein